MLRMEPYQQSDWIDRSRLILDSYSHWLKNDLLDRNGPDLQVAQRMYFADRVIVAHGTEEDPILCYANHAALQLWEADLATLLTMPSRKTAEPDERADRSEMLRRGLEKGFIEDYSGIRVSTSGRRFLIRQATVWNLIDQSGMRAGQAATFDTWEYLEDE